MKVAIIGPTEPLKNLVLFTRQFSSQVECNSFEEVIKDKKVDVLLTERGSLQANDIIQLRSQFPAKKIIVLADVFDPFFEKSCLAHDVLLLSKEWSEREQLNVIQKQWFGLEEQTEYHNVIAIHGTHRQVGTTQVALSVGHTLGSFNYKTLVIGLNPFNSMDDHKRKDGYSLDQVYELIQSNVITDGQSLIPYLEKYDSFYHLPSNRDFYKALTFEEKTISTLIHIAKEHFQAVILDVGGFYDSFLTLTGMKLSNTHILISSQEQQSLDEYERWNEQILSRFEFFPKTKYQVINKFGSKSIITMTLLQEKLEVPVLTHIPYFPEANDAIVEDGILYFSEYKPFNKAIDGIAKAIGDELTAASNNGKEGKGLLSALFGRR